MKMSAIVKSASEKQPQEHSEKIERRAPQPGQHLFPPYTTPQHKMLYRAIRHIDEENGYEGKTCVIRHFASVTDAYKWLQPTLEVQERERWHIRLLWSVIEDLKVYEANIEEVGYNEPLNPEQTPPMRLYIQKVDFIDEPLPIL